MAGKGFRSQDALQALLWAGAAFLLMYWFMPRFSPQPPPPAPQDSGNGASLADGSTTSPQATPSAPAATQAQLSAAEAEAETSLTLGDAADGGDYRMAVTLSNVGGSVTRVELTDHKEHASGDEKYRLLAQDVRPDGTTFRAIAVERINIDGADLVLLNRKWVARTLEWADGQAVEMSIDVSREGSPLARVVRTFKLPKQESKSGQHDLLTDLRVENLTAEPHGVIVTYTGGMGVRQTGGRGEARGFNVGVALEGEVVGSRKAFGELHKTPQQGLKIFDPADAGAGSQLSWAAQDNQYFTCTLAPLGRSGAPAASYIRQVWAIDADGVALTTEDVTLRFITAQETLAAAGQPGSMLEYPAEVYLGPKAATAFKTVPRYVQRNYYFQVAVGFGWCTFTWLVEFMIWLLNMLHWALRDYGLALIGLVFIVRTLLHPLTKWGQVNMVRMQKQMGGIQGKMEEIKKKFPNDRVKQGQEQAALLREAGVNPAGQFLTCLPMFCQVPIWGALYLSLSTNILMRHQPFLWSWPRDLTAQDGLVTFAAPFHLPLMGDITAINLLPFLLGVSMFIQQKLMPKPPTPPNQTPEQKAQAEAMQRMMPIMSVMMVFIFYSAPSGLNLYIMASSIFGAIEQQRIRKHIREQEAAGTFDRPKGKSLPPPGARRKGWFGAWLERIQKMAEEAQRQQGASRKPTRGK